jgi:hypothetical protein
MNIVRIKDISIEKFLYESRMEKISKKTSNEITWEAMMIREMIKGLIKSVRF